jgi:hypothetical protein
MQGLPWGGSHVPTAEQQGPPKLRLELGGLPDLKEAIAPKAKWRPRRTYQRLRDQARALEAAIGRRRFRKLLDTRILAYHVS